MQISVERQSVKYTDVPNLVAGSVLIYHADVRFSEDWDGYSKMIVFARNDMTYMIEVPVEDGQEQIVIPWEILEKPGLITIGAYGFNGEMVKPTIWGKIISVAKGTEPGETGKEPTKTELAKLLETVGNKEELTTEEKENLVRAINEINARTGGVSSVNGFTGEVELGAEDVGALPDTTEIPEAIADLTEDAQHRTVTDAEKETWNAKQDAGDYALSSDVTAEAAARQNANTALQGQIDALVSKSDVVDVVADYAALIAYDTTELLNNDVVKVLSDSTHQNGRSYYRWVIDEGTGSWEYIGTEGVGYTKAEADALLNGKQATIDDLNDIRDGASAGATAVQHSEIATVATSGSYDDLTDKPDIPSAVTEQTIADWGFTKNTGTYSKPNTGIPKSDLADGVQTSLELADSALQEHQSLAGYATETYVGQQIAAAIGDAIGGEY